MKKFLTAALFGGALLLAAGPAVNSVRADLVDVGPEPLPEVTLADLTNAGFQAIDGVKTMRTAYDFSPDTSPAPRVGTDPDGYIASTVLANGSGVYAYLYQVQALSPASHQVSSVQVSWGPNDFQTASLGTHTNQYAYQIAGTTVGASGYFQVDGDGLDVTKFVFGSSGTGGTLRRLGELEVNQDDGNGSELTDQNIHADMNIPTTTSPQRIATTIWVVFSKAAPGQVLASMIDGTPTSVSLTTAPMVYSPTPEPASVVLFGIAGVGLAGSSLYRRLRRPVALA